MVGMYCPVSSTLNINDDFQYEVDMQKAELDREDSVKSFNGAAITLMIKIISFI